MLYSMAVGLKEALSFIILSGVLTTQEIYKFTQDKKDIVQFLNFQELDSTVI